MKKEMQMDDETPGVEPYSVLRPTESRQYCDSASHLHCNVGMPRVTPSCFENLIYFICGIWKVIVVIAVLLVC